MPTQCVPRKTMTIRIGCSSYQPYPWKSGGFDDSEGAFKVPVKTYSDCIASYLTSTKTKTLGACPCKLTNTMCDFFSDGKCKEGDRCIFLHTEKPLPTVFHTGNVDSEPYMVRNKPFEVLPAGPRVDARIYLKHIPDCVDDKWIRQVCEVIGNVTVVQIMKPKNIGNHAKVLRAGFVHMESEAHANQVVVRLNAINFGSKPLVAKIEKILTLKPSSKSTRDVEGFTTVRKTTTSRNVKPANVTTTPNRWALLMDEDEPVSTPDPSPSAPHKPNGKAPMAGEQLEAEAQSEEWTGVLAIAKELDAKDEATKQLQIARDAEIAQRETDDMPPLEQVSPISIIDGPWSQADNVQKIRDGFARQRIEETHIKEMKKDSFASIASMKQEHPIDELALSEASEVDSDDGMPNHDALDYDALDYDALDDNYDSDAYHEDEGEMWDKEVEDWEDRF